MFLKSQICLVDWFEVSNCKLNIGSNQWVNIMSFKLDLINFNGNNYDIWAQDMGTLLKSEEL